MSWSYIGGVITGTTGGGGATTGTITLPASVHGGDLIVVACSFYATTFTQASFTAQEANIGGGASAANDILWVGTRIAAGPAGSATTDSTFTITFGATTWGEWIVGVYRSTAGVGTITKAVYNANGSGVYSTACPDATHTIGGSGNLALWGYSGMNAAVGTTATTFSGTGPSALTNFIQNGQTANGGGVGMGWKTGLGSPGGATANQAVDAIDFVLDVTEAAAGLVEAAGPVYVTSSTNVATTASFTPTANSLMVAIVAAGNGGLAAGTLALTDTSGAGSWTQLAGISASASQPWSGVAVLVKDAGASPGARTVTATYSSASVHDTTIIVRQFAGAALQASQAGVTVSQSTVNAATCALTPGTTGSQVVGAFGYGFSGVTLTATAATSIYGQHQVATTDTSALFEAMSLSTAASPVTLGWSAPTTYGGSQTAFVLAEILPAAAAATVKVSTLNRQQAVMTAATR